MIPSQLWSPERENILIECIAKKMSATQTGELLGITRNACCGKANRMGLKFLSIKPKKASKPRVKREPRIDITPKFPYREAPAMAPVIEVEPLNLTLWEVADNSCRWITNDDMKAALYCGLPQASDGCSWCCSHRLQVYQPLRVAR